MIITQMQVKICVIRKATSIVKKNMIIEESRLNSANHARY